MQSFKKLYAYVLALCFAMLSTGAMAQTPAYTVPTYLSEAVTNAGVAFAAIIAIVATGILVATVGKSGLKMVIAWVGKFFKG